MTFQHAKVSAQYWAKGSYTIFKKKQKDVALKELRADEKEDTDLDIIGYLFEKSWRGVVWKEDLSKIFIDVALNKRYKGNQCEKLQSTCMH